MSGMWLYLSDKGDSNSQPGSRIRSRAQASSVKWGGVHGASALATLSSRDPAIGRALATLAAEGKAAGSRSAKISVRVGPGVLAAVA
jgi:hypothetical protein